MERTRYNRPQSVSGAELRDFEYNDNQDREVFQRNSSEVVSDAKE